MKIAFLTQYYPPEIGAPQARLSGWARQFRRRGHDVTVLTAMPNYPAGRIHPGYGGLVRREELDGIRVLRAPIYPTQRPDIARRMSSYLSFVCSSALYGTLLLDRIDYLMVESPPLFLGAAAAWLGLAKRTRVIFNISDLWPDSAARLGIIARGGAAYRWSARLEAICYRRAWLVTGQTRGIVDDVAARFPSVQTYHLPNGVDAEMFAPHRGTVAARAELNGHGGCVALYAGLHGLAQGLDQVVDAAVRLRDDAGMQFVLVGEGPEKERLQHRVRDHDLSNVRFLDVRPAAAVPPLLASADILLVTLRAGFRDAVPSKLYEAMASGRAIIVISDGEAADLVRQRDAGLAVAPGDTDALAAALVRLRCDPRLRARLGDNARRAAQEQFDRARIVDRFIEHLEAALPAPDPRTCAPVAQPV